MCQSSKISRRHPSKMQQSTRISVISPEQCNMLGRTKLVIPDFAALLVSNPAAQKKNTLIHIS